MNPIRPWSCPVALEPVQGHWPSVRSPPVLRARFRARDAGAEARGLPETNLGCRRKGRARNQAGGRLATHAVRQAREQKSRAVRSCRPGEANVIQLPHASIPSRVPLGRGVPQTSHRVVVLTARSYGRLSPVPRSGGHRCPGTGRTAQGAAGGRSRACPGLGGSLSTGVVQ
jgi:hypothetical protein